MRTAFVAEWRKLTTTRMWWVLGVLMVGYLAFITAVVAASFSADLPEGAGAGLPALTGRDAALATYSLVNSIGYVFPLLIGTLLMTGEFRHGTITSSLLAAPSRSRLLAAKLLVALPLGIGYGIAATAAVALAGVLILEGLGDGAFLSDGDAVAALALGVVVIALWTVIGVGLGAMVPNQVAAVVIVLAFTQFVEPIARVALGSIGGGLDVVAAYLPGAAADAVIGASFFASLGAGDPISRWVGALVLVGYALAFAAIGRVTTLRRDIG